MALNSSGPISLSGSVIGESIYLELETLYRPSGGVITGSIGLKDKWVTALAQKLEEQSVNISDLYSKQKVMTNAVLNRTTVSGTGTSSSTISVSTTIENIVTVTVTGGLYPLKYLWENIGTNPTVTAVSSTSSSTRFAANVACASSETTNFRCKITDLSGAIIYSDEVTVTLTNDGACPP